MVDLSDPDTRLKVIFYGGGGLLLLFAVAIAATPPSQAEQEQSRIQEMAKACRWAVLTSNMIIAKRLDLGHSTVGEVNGGWIVKGDAFLDLPGIKYDGRGYYQCILTSATDQHPSAILKWDDD